LIDNILDLNKSLIFFNNNKESLALVIFVIEMNSLISFDNMCIFITG